MPAQEYGRPSQAPGVGQNAKRHDLSDRSVPYMHGSDLQYGEVGAMRDAQSALGPRTQQPASATTPNAAPRNANAPIPEGVPDPITFFGGRTKSPASDLIIRGDFQMEDWLPIASATMNGSGSSSLLRRLFIRQLRNVQMSQQQFAELDLNERDDALGQALGIE